MPARAEFTVTDAYARRRCVGPNIRRTASAVANDARAASKSRRVAAAFTVEPGRDPATWLITNPLKLARYHEYGTIRNAPTFALGRAMAKTGLPRWTRVR